MKPSNILRFSLFLLVIYVLHNITYTVNLDKSTSKLGKKVAKDTEKRIKTIADDLQISSFQIGGVRSASADNWTYVGGRFYLDKCIDYDDFKKAIIHSGFRQMGSVSMFCRGDVIFLSNGASRYKNGLLCDQINFSYSWKLHENTEHKECYEN